VTELHGWEICLSLYCAGNQVGDSGAVMLAEALQQNSTLTLLHLACK